MAAKAYFVVHALRNFEGTLPSPAKLLKEVRYPPPGEDIPGVVTTAVGLWEVKINVSVRLFTQSYWESVFNHTEDYNIILYQNDPISKKTYAFALHETADLALSECAFERLLNTVQPLVDDCNVVFTKELLELIILPEPVEASKLPLHLTDMMRLHPRAHKDWFRVIRALTIDALRKDDEEGVDALLDLPEVVVDVDDTNRTGNTLLHYARSGRSVRKMLEKATTGEMRERLLNEKNGQGKTALDVALERNETEVVTELLELEARWCANRRRSRNSLHVAAAKCATQSIAAAIQPNDNSKPDAGFDLKNTINSLDEEGFTPLMVSVREQHVDGCCVFLQAGADPDIRHGKTGRTAVHYAAEHGNATIVKVLIAFGAKIDIKDNEGRTPLDLAQTSTGRNTKDCIEALEKTTRLIAKAEAELSEVAAQRNERARLTIPSDSIVLLSMDGGGCRGLLTCQTLAAIQDRMKQLQPDCGPLHTYVDYIAGTSAGALIGLCVTSGMGLGGTRATIFKVAEDVFKHPPTFPSHVVDKATKQTFGSEKVLTEIKSPRLIVTTVLADQNPPVLHLVCNYGEARNGQKPPHEWKVWEVGRATSAAPIYFTPHEEKFVDGGVMANNPTIDAMVEIFSQAEREGVKAKLGLVVSIGTGIAPSAKVDNVGILVPNLQNAVKSIPKLIQTFSGLSHLLQLFIAQSTKCDGEEVERARVWCKSLDVPYFRFSAPVEKLVDLAENDKVVLTDLMYQGALYNLSIAKEIDAVARYLLSRPRPRMSVCGITRLERPSCEGEMHV